MCKNCLKFAENQINIHVDVKTKAENADKNDTILDRPVNAEDISCSSSSTDTKFQDVLAYVKCTHFDDNQMKKLYTALGQKLCKPI